MIFGQMGAFQPQKAPKSSLRERIRRVLAGGRTIIGRGELQRELWPDGKWTLEDTADLNRAVNGMVQDGELVETRLEVPGAHEFAPAVEWSYRLGPGKLADELKYWGVDFRH